MSPVTRPSSGPAAADGLARVQPYSYAQGGVVQPQPRSDLLDTADDGKPRPDGPLDVIVTCPRQPEDRHRRVTDELFEAPAVPTDRFAHHREVGVLDRGDVFRVEGLRQRREADEVAEQDGNNAALNGRLCRGFPHGAKVSGCSIAA